ncbi:MAG: hypothetical protein COA68_00835 [Oceanobacter sp.]|nr:MAG: hypothetical protein COA68_00835 [Oceanobacter sp.]
MIQSITRKRFPNEVMLNQIERYLKRTLVILFACLLTACDYCCDEILRGKKIEEVSITSQNIVVNTDDNEAVQTLKPEGESNTDSSDETSVGANERQSSNDATDDVPLTYSPLDEVIDNNKNRQILNLTLPTMAWETDSNGMSNHGVLPNVFRPLPHEQTVNLSGRIHWDESEEARQLSVEDSIKGAEVELKFFLP